MNDKLLNSWVAAVMNIRNNRFLDELSLNEMVVIKTLIDEPNATASKLCEVTGLLKSQMNHILQGMEKKCLLIRERHGSDKRKIQLTLTGKALETHKSERNKVGAILEVIEKELGIEQTEQLSSLMEKAVMAIRKETAND